MPASKAKKSNSFYHLQCVSCGIEISEKESVTACPKCGEGIDVVIDPIERAHRVARDFDKSAHICGKKYAAFYPLHDIEQAVSLGEGDTPLTRVEKIGKALGFSNLLVKNEGQNPTGVFKDRGSLIEITKAKELGAEAICVASTGNMAASVAAYSAVAGLPCYVLIPEGTPLGKLSQAMSYGARVLQLRGTYGDCCRLAAEMAAKYGYYLAGDYAFRGEGQKSIAFEIVEQLDWKAPDVVICPVGCGTNLAAIWKGFQEFYEAGFIDSLPRMIAVQPDGCNTVVSAFQKKKKRYTAVPRPQTVCSAVGINTPIDDIKALRALKESGGDAVEVTDREALACLTELAQTEAIFVEVSGALPLAAAKKMKKEKRLKKDETVVLIATGAGLKDPKTALSAHPTPPAVEPEMREIDRFIEFKLYEIRSAGHDRHEKMLFKKTPTVAALKSAIKKELNADLKQRHLKIVCGQIADFLAKGKSVRKSDLQHLVEDVLTDLSYEERVFVIEDYEVQITKKSPAKAVAQVCFHSSCMRGEGQGVGPVDAVIRAFCDAISSQDKLGVRLTDYSVQIDDAGVDATTEVSMKLVDCHGNSTVATATSPDVVTASIAAFEKGYNILYWKRQK